MSIVDQQVITLDAQPVTVEFAVQPGAASFSHLIDITGITDPAVTVSMAIEMSEDGGPFQPEGNFTFAGGKYMQPDGRTPATVAGLDQMTGSEGTYSTDAGKTFASMVGLPPEKYQALAKSADVIYGKQQVVRKSLTVRKTFKAIGNAGPLQFSTMTATE